MGTLVNSKKKIEFCGWIFNNMDFLQQLPEKLVYEISKDWVFPMALTSKWIYNCIRSQLKPEAMAEKRYAIYEICGDVTTSVEYLDWIVTMYNDEGTYRYKIDRQRIDGNVQEMIDTYGMPLWMPITASNPLLFAIAGRNLDAISYLWNKTPVHCIDEALQMTVWRQERNNGFDNVFSDPDDNLDVVMRKYFEYLELTYKFTIDANMVHPHTHQMYHHYTLAYALAGQGFIETYKWANDRGFEYDDDHMDSAIMRSQLQMINFLLPFYSEGPEGVISLAIDESQYDVVAEMINNHNMIFTENLVKSALWTPTVDDLKYLLSLGDKVVWPRFWGEIGWESLAMRGGWEAIIWIYEYNEKNKDSPYIFSEWNFNVISAIMMTDIGESWVKGCRNDMFMWLVKKGCPVARVNTIEHYDGRIMSVDLINCAIRLGEHDILNWLIKHFGISSGSSDQFWIYDENAAEQAVTDDDVRMMSYVSAKYLAENEHNILMNIRREGAKNVLEWLYSGCKNTDFRISEENYLWARSETIKNQRPAI